MKYKTVDLPLPAWEAFKEKQKKLSEAFSSLTGKKKKIPMTKVYIETAKNPMFLTDSELVKLFKKGKLKI